MLILGAILLSSMEPMMIDFGKEKAGQTWRILNDGVMGGRSASTIDYSEDHLRFAGTISLENNGGFASMRSPYGSMDLSEYKELRMRVRGDGSSFGMVLETSRTWFYPNYKVTFDATEEWQELVFSLRDFDEYVVGRKQGKKMTDKNLQNVIRLGIITNDKAAKPFQLDIDYIELK